MTTFKIIVTLILISVIGLALLIGPPIDDGGKELPGQQSPAPLGPPPGGPATLVVLLAMVGMPMVGIGKRLISGG